jgi:hypothetical protein
MRHRPSRLCTDGQTLHALCSARDMKKAASAAFFMFAEFPDSEVPVKHHHIHLVAHSHVALAVAQHDQAIGLHHGAEHT